MQKSYEAKFLLYVILDRELLRGRDPAAAARAAAAGGADLIQYRDKISPDRDFEAAARRIREILADFALPLIINDRLNIALAVGAAGVHLGSEDISIASARRRGGEEMIIGASARTPARARRAEDDGADYLGVGAFFPTTTKKDAPVIARKVFTEICSGATIPVIAIGGITPRNLTLPLSLGAAGIAVASAVWADFSPKTAVARLPGNMS